MKKDKFYVYLPMILGIVLIILSILNSFENNNVYTAFTDMSKLCGSRCKYCRYVILVSVKQPLNGV